MDKKVVSIAFLATSATIAVLTLYENIKYQILKDELYETDEVTKNSTKKEK